MNKTLHDILGTLVAAAIGALIAGFLGLHWWSIPLLIAAGAVTAVVWDLVVPVRRPE